MEKPKPVKRTNTCKNLKGVEVRNFACDIKKEATNIKQLDTGVMLGAFNPSLRAIQDKYAPPRTRTVTHRPSGLSSMDERAAQRS
ncbi:hypothetical protein ElyMa_002025400 [Elysia marginata]|uniref:Uncharacterized protein n=1 Tax=Elysia marginata TaxID=1093978 RepID=A0AAV4F6A5_9GAST|nr:hypothetical protein ElyMa_002025400 [Elysia marginata]